jgi:hypothetical protein
MRWHHYAGLLFGLLSFTFVISGAFSVNPFGMFSGTPVTREQREAVTGLPSGLNPLRSTRCARPWPPSPNRFP